MKNNKLQAFFARKQTAFTVWLSDNTPPGYDLRGEYGFFITVLILSCLYAQGFLIRYVNAYMDLLAQMEMLGVDVYQIAPFSEVFGHAWNGYFFVMLCMLLYAIPHYLYYYRETKSIYLMRRLPDKWEYHRRALTVTLREMLLCLALALLTFFIDYLIYVWNTPAACLPNNILSSFFTAWIGG